MADDAGLDLGAALKTKKKTGEKKAVTSLDDFLEKKAKKEKKKKEEGCKDVYNETERAAMGLAGESEMPVKHLDEDEIAAAKKLITSTRVVAINGATEEKTFDWKKVKDELDSKAPPPAEAESTTSAPTAGGGKFVARGKGDQPPKLEFASLEDVYANSASAPTAPAEASPASEPVKESESKGSSPVTDGAPAKYVPGSIRGGTSKVGPTKMPPAPANVPTPTSDKAGKSAVKLPAAEPTVNATPQAQPQPSSPAVSSPTHVDPNKPAKYVPGSKAGVVPVAKALPPPTEEKPSASPAAPLASSAASPASAIPGSTGKYVPGSKTGVALAPKVAVPAQPVHVHSASGPAPASQGKYTPGAMRGPAGASAAPQGAPSSSGAYRPGAMKQQQQPAEKQGE